MMSRVFVVPMVMIALAAPAAAQDHVAQVNRAYASVPAGKRSDLVLLPAAGKMDEPPAAVGRMDQAMLLPAGASAWSAVEQWAMAAPQRAVLEALEAVTKEEDALTAMVFAQPYGAEALSGSSEGVALIQAGLYTELGDPPMLAAARIGYMPALERVMILVHVEATRLAAGGDPRAAIDLLVDWLFFSRQMADRVMSKEMRFGLRSMIYSLDRIRDIAYTDFRSRERKLTGTELTEMLQRTREDDNGYLRVDRIRFPGGDRIAAAQVIARTYLPRPPRGPDPAVFPTTMARLASSERPLRLFSESARCQAAGAFSADGLDMEEALKRVYDEWEYRWSLRPFDPMLANQTAYERLDRARFAALDAVLPDLGGLGNERDVLRAQLAGTRCALGLVAFNANTRGFPPHLSSIRPAYVKELDADPFNPRQRDRGGKPPLEYFVPIRDTRDRFGSREDPRPHEIKVFTPGGETNFRAVVGEDQFVLYSVGPNGAKEWAENVSPEPPRTAPGDLLLWPPFISLYREELRRTGKLR